MKQRRRARWAVYGTVQGVGFRWFVQSAARRHSLAGWTMNRADGAVEIEAEGEPDAVHQLLRTVEHGPPGAHVDRLEHLPTTADPLPLPFIIRR